MLRGPPVGLRIVGGRESVAIRLLAAQMSTHRLEVSILGKCAIGPRRVCQAVDAVAAFPLLQKPAPEGSRALRKALIERLCMTSSSSPQVRELRLLFRNAPTVVDRNWASPLSEGMSGEHAPHLFRGDRITQDRSFLIRRGS